MPLSSHPDSYLETIRYENTTYELLAAAASYWPRATQYFENTGCTGLVCGPKHMTAWRVLGAHLRCVMYIPLIHAQPDPQCNPSLVGVVKDTYDLDCAQGIAVNSTYAFVDSSQADPMSVVDVPNKKSHTLVGIVKDIDNLNGAWGIAVNYDCLCCKQRGRFNVCSGCVL